MTTLVNTHFLPGLKGTHFAHLAACRDAWREAVLAYGEMDETNNDRLTRAVYRLALMTGLDDVSLRVMQTYCDLKDFPVPIAPNEAAENAMWDLFFLLVLAVQTDDNPRMYTYSEQLAVLVAGTGIHSKWWLKRARAYAPLGLTLATRV